MSRDGFIDSWPNSGGGSQTGTTLEAYGDVDIAIRFSDGTGSFNLQVDHGFGAGTEQWETVRQFAQTDMETNGTVLIYRLENVHRGLKVRLSTASTPVNPTSGNIQSLLVSAKER